MGAGAAPLRLNVGCGRNILPGWKNIDGAALAGVDVVADLEQCATRPLPFADDSAGEFLLSHVLEHIRNPLALMQELHRIACPGAAMTVRTPYGTSDDAWEDPTHVRPYFPGSFRYFAQPVYWRADYGYRGDWDLRKVTLVVNQAMHAGRSQEQILDRIRTARNAVQEMVAELVAVKPARPPRKETPAVYETVISLV